MKRRQRAVTAAIAMLGMTAAGVLPGSAGSPPTVTREVALSAVAVPPGGLISSFVTNQVLYCSIVCPLLIETALTAGGTTVQAPAAFLAAARSGDVVRAIGVAIASVTGPTNEAAQETILADGSMVAPRVLNALEVGVVGLLDVLPAATDGLPAIVDAVKTARGDTFAALHAPVVADPAPLATPHGVVQVAVVETINVGAAIVFPAFNEILSAVFDVPDAVAQELAATGKLGRAAVAGVRTAAGHLDRAIGVVRKALVAAGAHVRAAAQQARAARPVTDAPGIKSRRPDDKVGVATNVPARAHRDRSDRGAAADRSERTHRGHGAAQRVSGHRRAAGGA